MATKEQRVLNERDSLVEYAENTQGQPLDFNLVLGSIQNATSARELDSNLVSIFDQEDPNFSENFTLITYLGAAMGARAGNPKRLKQDEVDLMVEPDFKLITGRQVKFEYALNLLENRVAVTKTYYEDLPQDLKKLSFYVSGLEKLREVELVKTSLSNAISAGYSFQEWKDSLDVGAFTDLSNARLQTVYRNNINNVYNQSLRYNAGTSDVTPYLQYTAIGDSETRPSHLRLDGTIKRADSEFWDRYTPPIGHNCRCGVISLTDEEAKDLGISGRNNDSFPKPDEGFGDKDNKTYGNVLGATVSATEKALNDLPTNSPYRSRFQNSIDSVDQKVDIWWESVKNIFER